MKILKENRRIQVVILIKAHLSTSPTTQSEKTRLIIVYWLYKAKKHDLQTCRSIQMTHRYTYQRMRRKVIDRKVINNYH